MKSNEPIMIFKVTLDPADITEMKTPLGAVSFLPFTAAVESDIFTGGTRPGAVDVQQENAAGIRNMCAKYIFEGVDKEGRACRLFVENNAYFTPADDPGAVLPACPRFLTDSPILGEYLHQPRFRSEVRPAPGGVEIWVFDVCL